MNGTDVVLYVSGVAVGSQRDVSFDEATANIDMSSKDSRNQRVEPGRYSATVTLDALYVPTDAAYLALKAAMRNGLLVSIVRFEDGAALEEADAVVNTISEKAPDQDAATISVSLTLDGGWTAGS